MIVGGSERMKGLELNVTKQNGMTFVEYHLGAADAYDDRVSDKVAQLGNIIPFQYKDEDGKRSIVSYVHNDNTLEVILKRTLKKAEALAVIKGLLCAFEIGAAGVQISYLVRDAKYIYVDPESFAVKCIMVPVKQDALGQSDIPDFFRNIVAHMRFDDADSDNYVARILTLINTDHYSNMKLKELVDAEMEKIGVFYTRDEGIRSGLDTHAAPDVNKDVKVNRVGVMNNMRPQMGQPGMPMGQPGMPPMGQPGMPPMGQPGVPPMGQPGMPPMGQPGMPPMGQPGMPPMGQPGMPRPQMGQPGMPPMGQPQMPQMGQPGMPQMPKPEMPQMPKPEMPKPQAPQMGQPGMPQMPKPEMPKPQAPQMGQPGMPQMPKPEMPKPQAPQMGQPGMPQMPKPEMPKPQAPQMGQPGMPQMPKPEMPKPQAPQMPKPEMPKPQAPQMPKPEMPKPEMPKPQAPQMPKPEMPKPEMPKPQAPQMGQPQMPNGGLMGQLGGARPIPHLIRKKTGEIINITKPEFVIGKSKTKADYAIENNSAISREHCTVIQRDGVNYIKDDNSTNHTYVNGVELQPGKEVLLKHKTEIRMGDEEFTFLLRKGE